MVEYFEGLNASDAEVGVEVAGAIPGVAADAGGSRGADLKVFLAAAGEVRAVDVGAIRAGILSSAEVSGWSCWGDGRGALNESNCRHASHGRPGEAGVVLEDAVDLPGADESAHEAVAVMVFGQVPVAGEGE